MSNDDRAILSGACIGLAVLLTVVFIISVLKNDR